MNSNAAGGIWKSKSHTVSLLSSLGLDRGWKTCLGSSVRNSYKRWPKEALISNTMGRAWECTPISTADCCSCHEILKSLLNANQKLTKIWYCAVTLYCFLYIVIRYAHQELLPITQHNYLSIWYNNCVINGEEQLLWNCRETKLTPNKS